MGSPRGATAMFTSSNTFSIDESKLCFNKTHFNREDFNVERFMNLARQKADLKTIQQDLRLYLKSVQNSMIELINDDYADFVHLSSKLVSLQESLNKIDQDIHRTWSDFEESTRESVGMAEKVEQKCNELSSNREKQSELRDRVSFLYAIERLSEMLQLPPKKCSVLWLQKAENYVVELKSATSSYQHNEDERNAENFVLSELGTVLCTEGVRSASTDCQNLSLILSILSLSGDAHSLTAHLVSDLLYPKFVNKGIRGEEENQLEGLESVYCNVKEMRQSWSEKLGPQQFRGKTRSFLDDTLLTFILTYIDKCLGTVAVPSNTRLFHQCFSATQHFIDTWPSGTSCRMMLKSIKDKFNFVVYFKLETHRFGKQVDELLIPANYKIIKHKKDNNNESFHFETSKATFAAIEHVWSDDVYLEPIVDKLWDFTLRMLLKHYYWSESMRCYFVEENSDWTLMLFLRSDTEKLHQTVFDYALETIWSKIHDLSVDTAPFGQCLTKHGRAVNSLCQMIDSDIVKIFSEVLHQALAQVSDVPKQYRWTKRPTPTTHSKYVSNAIEMIDGFRKEFEKEDHPDIEMIISSVSRSAFSYFVGKAKEVQDSVEATGSSLSRFKRKTTVEGGASVSDDDKIKNQIHHDAKFLIESAENLSFISDEFEELREVAFRFETQKENENYAGRVPQSNDDPGNVKNDYTDDNDN